MTVNTSANYRFANTSGTSTYTITIDASTALYWRTPLGWSASGDPNVTKAEEKVHRLTRRKPYIPQKVGVFEVQMKDRNWRLSFHELETLYVGTSGETREALRYVIRQNKKAKTRFLRWLNRETSPKWRYSGLGPACISEERRKELADFLASC